MTIQNCQRCGSLYHKTVKNICGNCVQQEEEDYKKIRLFLKRNKTIELLTVSEETGIDLDVIYQFLQEGRVSLNTESTNGYPCKECGDAIFAGALCSSCEEKRNNVHQTLRMHSATTPTTGKDAPPKKKGAFHTKRV